MTYAARMAGHTRGHPERPGQRLGQNIDGQEAARETARINSYTVPTNVLTASDAGSDATIEMAAHTRVYPVEGSVGVPNLDLTAQQFTGLGYSATLFVFYDDPTLADPEPLLQVTSVQQEAQVGYAPGRHFVGRIVTPAAGGGDTGGDGPTPPGGGGGVIP